MELGLVGKTVIITGGASNIGRAISLAFGAEKSKVVIVDLDLQGAEIVAKKISEDNKTESLALKADITKPEEVETMVKKVNDTFGSVDVLVNDAAIMQVQPFLDTTYADWQKMAGVNVFGTAICCKAVLPYMIAQKKGAIVSVGSDAGRVGENRQTFYSGTKGHVIALMKGIAKEVGRHGIRCNSVCPGATPGRGEAKRGFWKDFPEPGEPRPEVLQLYALKRLGTPEEIASVVVFLASDAASFVTGQTISASGGFTMI